MKILFIPCSIDGLPKDSGSIRLRCLWPARYLTGAAVWDGTQRLWDYDAFVFQKAYLGGMAREMISMISERRDAGEPVRMAFDLCDSDTLDREHEARMTQVISAFDFVVTPTDKLARLMNDTYTVPVRVIPDRVDLGELARIADEYGIRHKDTGTDTPVLVWAGYVGAVEALMPLRDTVNELGLRLKILANQAPIPFELFWHKVVRAGDILVNPRAKDGPLSYKSENKTVISWSFGMPVARSAVELEYLCDSKNRADERAVWHETIAKFYNVRQSALDWVRLFAETGLEA